VSDRTGPEAAHRYRATVEWAGSTGGGYDAYDRGHRGATPPADADHALGSDPAFLGDPRTTNPEQLVVLAASSCQLLSFLAVAARARVDVVAYRDDAEGAMPTDVRPVRIATIVLRPHITVRGEIDEARLRHLCAVAHEHCYVANSLRTEVVVEPTFATAD
jgi:organic hydroperoxide reductase OsmC/OhrA